MARTIGMKRAKGNLAALPPVRRRHGARLGPGQRCVPVDKLEAETVNWCRDMLKLSPMALRMIKAGFNADTDGLAGNQELAGNATGLFYMSRSRQDRPQRLAGAPPTDFGKYRKRPATVICRRLAAYAALPATPLAEQPGARIGYAPGACFGCTRRTLERAGVMQLDLKSASPIWPGLCRRNCSSTCSPNRLVCPLHQWLERRIPRSTTWPSMPIWSPAKATRRC